MVDDAPDDGGAELDRHQGQGDEQLRVRRDQGRPAGQGVCNSSDIDVNCKRWVDPLAFLEVCTVLYCTELHSNIMYRTLLYCTVLYSTVLLCTILNSIM